MEPQLDSTGNYSTTRVREDGTNRPKKACGKGCFGIFGAIGLIAAVIIIAIVFIFPAMTPNSIKGDFINMTAVTDKAGKTKLWILTDGSFNFIQSTKSPGSYSVGRKCYFCKTWLYIYDPKEEKVIKKIKTEYKDIIISSDVVSSTTDIKSGQVGKVWVTTNAYGENPPAINVYDSENGELIMDKKSFETKYPILSGGISEIYSDRNNQTIKLKTRDGLDGVIFSIPEEKIYKDYTEYNSKNKNDSTMITRFVLSSENLRKNLYRVTGLAKDIGDKDFKEAQSYNEKSMEFFNHSKSEKIAGDKGFIEPLMLYQNDKLCIILHQEVADKQSDRMITCVDVNGNVRWMIPQKDLFKKTKVDKDDAFSVIFFMKSKFKGFVGGDTFIFGQDGEGIIGFDLQTGKRLWDLDI